MVDVDSVRAVAPEAFQSPQAFHSLNDSPSSRSVQVRPLQSDAHATASVASRPALDSSVLDSPSSVLIPLSRAPPPASAPADPFTPPGRQQDLNEMATIEDSNIAANRTSIQTITKGSIRSRYSIVRRIGRGRFGSVYEAVDRATNTRVAIKSIPKARQSALPSLIRTKVTEADVARQQRLVESEAEISLMLGSATAGQADKPGRAVSTSPAAVADNSVAEGAVDAGAADALAAGQGNVGQGNVVQVLSVVEGRQHFHIVMQLCRGGSLAEFLEKRRRGQAATLAAAADAVFSPAAASPAASSTAIPASGITPCPLHSCQVARPSARVAAEGDRSPVGFLPADSGNASPSPPATGVASDAESSPHRWYQAATWESNSEDEGGENEREELGGTDSAGRNWRHRMRDEERLGERGRESEVMESGGESERVVDDGMEQEDEDSVASQLKADWVPRMALTGKGMEKSASTGELAQLAEAAAAAAASFAGRTNAGHAAATGLAGSSTSAGAESAGTEALASSRVVVYGGMSEEGRKRQQEWEDEAAWIVSEIAAAVAYCHKRGILHRDIKPENVLLTLPPSSQPITVLASPCSPFTAAASSQDQFFCSARVAGRSTSVGQSTPVEESMLVSVGRSTSVQRSTSMKPSSEFLRKSPSFSILSPAAGAGAGAADSEGGGARARPVVSESGRYQAASVGAAAAHPPHAGAHGRVHGSAHGWVHGHRRSASLASWLGRTSLRKKQHQQQQEHEKQQCEKQQHQQLMQQLEDGIQSFKAGDTEVPICSAGVAAAFLLCSCTCQQQQHTHNSPLPSLSQVQGLRLADFGLAEKLQPGQTATRGLVGSPAYVAPEVAAGLPVSFPADVWGIGICLYMVLSGGQLPFSGRRTRLLLLNIRRAQLPMGTAAWVGVSGEAKDVVRKLLAADPKHRPSAEEVLQMPWVVNGRERWLQRQSGLMA
ncbi:unnamed protein product [Closterium sp. Yama58-4]|nr:unnamed protein product [Closterium sp. Yama58-4]